VGAGYYFHRPLDWVGVRPPSEEESSLLFEALENWLALGKPVDPVELETFLEELPESAWAASLHASLGRIEMLALLYTENSERTLDGGALSQRWERTREALGEMMVRPEVCYKLRNLCLGSGGAGVGAALRRPGVGVGAVA